jgi:hydrogenase maturation protease
MGANDVNKPEIVVADASADAAPNGCREGFATLHDYVLSDEAVPADLAPARIAVMCVGNRLMLDDGVGPAVFDELVEHWDIPDNIELFDLGCLSLAMIERVCEFDLLITVDAVDDSGEAPGTILRYAPEAMARHVGINASLHDLKLIDLFDAASLLGYHAEGLCLGMQVENASPAEATEGLTPAVHSSLPLLVDILAGELARMGSPITRLGCS